MTAHSEREPLARVMDPDAFREHPVERRSQVAALQWAVRRKIALDHADRALAAGFRQEPQTRCMDCGGGGK